MINLGSFASRSGKSYDCHFIPDEKMVQAVGPLPERVGARGVVFETQAISEEDTVQKISDAVKLGVLE